MFKKLYKIIVTLLLILWIGGYVAFIAGILVKTPNKPTIKTEAIIVLTGGYNRIPTGLSLFSQKLSKHLFITGVHSAVNKNDITNMWQGKTELPSCCITLGHEATTTLENAYESNDWVTVQNIKTIRLVTSAYHMDRALLEFKNALKGIEIISHPVEERNDQLQDFNFWRITFGEYNKTILRTIIITLAKQG